MKLFLQSSSGQPVLALWEHSVLLERIFAPHERIDYRLELSKALNEIGQSMANLSGIIVDTGPGRLAATRAAVAFANGLGFALKIPCIPVNSFVILGAYAQVAHNLPCLVLRKAARRQYHWALVENATITEAEFSETAEIVPAHFTGKVVIAGDATQADVHLPTLPDALWSGLNIAPSTVLGHLSAQLQPVSGPVVPLTAAPVVP